MKKKLSFLLPLILMAHYCFCWGFYAHSKISNYAVFLLPPEMLVFYKPNIDFIAEHATDPDKRRYAVAEEGPRHYIDIDRYGKYPYDSLPRKYDEAVAKYSADTIMAHGIVPWHVQIMLQRLTKAFKEKNFAAILKNSAELGHYVADAHVPLHTSSNHNGQLTNQRGIHGFWESRVPELLAEKEFDFFIGKASYISNPSKFIWDRVLESAKASDSVLLFEKELSITFREDQKYAFEVRNGKIIRQYSTVFSEAYNTKLNGMIERRMRQSIYSIASFWFTAWVNAGQPDLRLLAGKKLTEMELKEFDELNEKWKNTGQMIGRQED